jgi:hypothetical protein
MPAGETTRGLENIVLRIAAVNAQCMQFEQLATVVLVVARRFSFPSR